MAFYAAHHVLVKGGLFIALALLGTAAPKDRFLLVTIAIIALSLAGLPLTGGYVAKYAIKPVLSDGLAAVMGLVSSAGSTLLMLHFLRVLWRRSGLAARRSKSASIAWWALAAAATALPWLLLDPASGLSASGALGASALLDALWPMLAGAVIAGALFASKRALPSVPPGDIVAALPYLQPARRALGTAMESVDAFVRQWPVAGIALLLIALLLGVALGAGG